MTQEEFKRFVHELRMLVQKYGIRTKAGSEEIKFGITGKPVFNGFQSGWVERTVGIFFTEVLTPEEAVKEEGRKTNYRKVMIMGEENKFAGVGDKAYVLLKRGEEDEQIVDLTLNGETKIVHDSTEGFPISFTLKLPASLSELKAQIKSDLRRAKGLRHYAHKIMSKSAKKALRRCHLHMKKCMFGTKIKEEKK